MPARKKLEPVSVVLGKTDKKKNSVRYDIPKSSEANMAWEPVRTVYVNNQTCQELGWPEKIKVTIEAV